MQNNILAALQTPTTRRKQRPCPIGTSLRQAMASGPWPCKPPARGIAGSATNNV